MVGKLIKHEAIRTSGMLLTIFGAATLLVVLGALASATRWPVVAQIGLVGALVGTVGVLVGTQLAMGIDYWRSSYRRIGYFTQTLPVKGSTIYWAKLAWAAIAVVMGLVWAGVLGVLTFMGNATSIGYRPLDVFSLVGDWFSAAADVLPWWGWVAGPAIVLVYLMFPVVQYFFAASIGSERRLVSLGVGGPVLVWFLLYVVMQVTLLLGMIAIPFGLTVSDGRMALVGQNFLQLMLDDSQPGSMPIGFVPVLLVALVMLVWRTTVSWNRKVTLA